MRVPLGGSCENSRSLSSPKVEKYKSGKTLTDERTDRQTEGLILSTRS